MRNWTEAAKAAQRDAIKRWQPWSKSTGPRTAAGKQRTAMNARKLDRPSVKSIRTLNAALTAAARSRKACNEILFWQKQKNSEKRTIMLVYLKSVFRAADRALYQLMNDWCTLLEADNLQNQRRNPLYLDKNIRMAA